MLKIQNNLIDGQIKMNFDSPQDPVFKELYKRYLNKPSDICYHSDLKFSYHMNKSFFD